MNLVYIQESPINKRKSATCVNERIKGRGNNPIIIKRIFLVKPIIFHPGVIGDFNQKTERIYVSLIFCNIVAVFCHIQIGALGGF